MDSYIKRHLFIRDAKGQTLVIIPFVVILLIAAVFITLNVGVCSNTYIRMQTAADAAARNGALAQAECLMLITPINDAIMALYARIINRIQKGAKAGPIGIAAALIASAGDFKKIKKLQKVADAIKYAAVALAIAGIERGAIENGAAMAAPISVPTLDLDWQFLDKIVGKWLSKVIGYITGLKGVLARSHDDVRETVKVVIVWKQAWESIKDVVRYIFTRPLKGTGPTIIGDKLLEKDLAFPNIKAFSCARPYWMGVLAAKDPRNDRMRYDERLASMRIPGCYWEAKIIKFKL
ncbi:MAG: hypothetical protein HQ558_03790 [Candidatus Omnitrophica bacterium]|nr:hypothetical protein [Candidatus Omnitrophota bacterium]